MVEISHNSEYFMQKYRSLLASLLITMLVTLSPMIASAENNQVTIGKGSIVSKRVSLTRHHGMTNAHKIRINAIKARFNK